ncbi:hypothetical protein SESBI_42759 [Sesbania bispinosa]|nr:hypothetical protein SESBI_42759 [Sesbania bispinosa]
MPTKSQTTKTMDEVAMLKALCAKERNAKAVEKTIASSVEILGSGPVQGDGINPSAQRKNKRSTMADPWFIRLGMKNLGKKIQSSGAQMGIFRLCVDQYVSGAEKEVKKLLAELLAEKGTWAEKFTDLEKKNGDLQKKHEDLVVENKNLGSKSLKTPKLKLPLQHAAGFGKAVSQLQFLYPDLKVDEVGAFKHVVEGKLVDIVVDEDEE